MSGKIYVTGDCHGSFSKFNTKNFPEQKSLTKEDIVIICGDFGGIWFGAENKEEKYNMDMLENRPFTTLFVDGNHENFDRFSSMPVSEWNGGKVQFIRPSIIHLMRGQVYTIYGKTFFTFGGASSHDMPGGILDKDDPLFKRKSRRLFESGILYRVRNVSWWEAELPSEEEMEEGIRNLERQNWEVDYVITHCAPDAFVPCKARDVLVDYLDMISQKLTYKRWYFGHYHFEKKITENVSILYHSVEKIS